MSRINDGDTVLLLKQFKVMRLFLLFGFFFFHFCPVNAQGKMVNLKVGDSLTFGKCANKPHGFVSVDLMIRTRWQSPAKPYNKVTGEGFYESYFTGSDFSPKRMPCHYEGLKVRIVSIHQFPKDDKSGMRTVFFAQTGKNENELFWIEIEIAATNGELVF